MVFLCFFGFRDSYYPISLGKNIIIMGVKIMIYKEYKEKHLQNSANKKEQKSLYENLMEGLTEDLTDIRTFGEPQGRKTTMKTKK